MKIPPFNLVLTTSATIALISGGTAAYLASYPELTPQQQRIFDACVAACQVGSSATLGLVGMNLPR